jgi:ketosteroid isomerase-like protein
MCETSRMRTFLYVSGSGQILATRSCTLFRVKRPKEVEGILEARTDSAVALARAEEAEAVALLHRLNAQYIRAFVEADVAWYVENLTADFTCSLSDGTRIGKEAFLRKIASGPGVTDVRYDEVDVRPLGDVALVHGVTHYVRNGEPASTRYTDVWRREAGRWRAVAAQLTGVGN